jgi:phage-related protein
MSRTIIFYRTGSGHCPVEEFLDSLNGKQAQKVAWVLRLVEELDVIPSKYFKKLVNTKDLWEARIDFGRDTFRLIGFFDGNQMVVLVHGFQKKSQKIPKQMIELAHERKKDYFRRKSNE